MARMATMPPDDQPACKTCPYWQAIDAGLRGVCHGTDGPVVTAPPGVQMVTGQAFAVTCADDWCRVHPQAPK